MDPLADETLRLSRPDPFRDHQQALREQLAELLAGLPPSLVLDVECALQAEGKLLCVPSSQRPAGVWGLLTLLVAESVAPHVPPRLARSVALAVECLLCALDLFDDLEDDDQTTTIQALGPPRTLNVSTTLLLLAQRSLLSLVEHQVNSSLILALLNILTEATLTATSGQHGDLLAEQRSAMTMEECLEIAAQKAGSLMRLACRLGAMCAGADEATCEQVGHLGLLLGMAHQLDNDAHDLEALLHADGEQRASSTALLKTDLRRRKKTLPVVLAARKQAALQDSRGFADDTQQRQALRQGILAAWSVCLLYRERARLLLQEVETHLALAPGLRLLLGLEKGSSEDERKKGTG